MPNESLTPISRGLPSSLVTTLRYRQQYSYDTASGLLGSYSFRANSCFDPDYTGIGHQPMGFDQFAALFAHYTVLKSTIKVTVQPSAVQAIPLSFGIFLGSDYTFPTSWEGCAEQATAKSLVFGPAMSSYPLPTLSHSFDAKKFFGVKDPSDAVGTIGAAVGSSPTDLAYFNIWTQSLNMSADTTYLFFAVEIDYTVQFSEREKVAQS